MYIYIIVIKYSSHWTQASVLRFSCSVLSTGYTWKILIVATPQDWRQYVRRYKTLVIYFLEFPDKHVSGTAGFRQCRMDCFFI